MRYRRKKYAVCRRVRASFSADILQAGAVKGLKTFLVSTQLCTWPEMFCLPCESCDWFVPGSIVSCSEWIRIANFVYFVHLAQVSRNTADTTVQREAQISPTRRECSKFLKQQRHTCATRRWTLSIMDHCGKYSLGPATDVTPVICMSHKCHTSTWRLCGCRF